MDGRPQGGRVSYLTPVLQVGGVSGTSIKANSGHATGAFTQHAPLRPRSAATHQAAGSAVHAGSVPLAAFTGWVSAQPASSGVHGFSSASASPPGYSRQHSTPLYQQLSRTATIPASALAGNSISAAAVAIGNAVAADAPRLMAAAAAAAHHQQQHHYQSNPSPPPSHWRSASAAITTSSGSAAHHYPSYHHRSSFLSSPNAAGTTFAAGSSAFGSPTAVASPTPPMPVASPIAAAPGMQATSGSTAGPHDSLIAQIEAQWSDYMAAVADEEANGATSKPASSAAANGRVSALPSLLAQLQSNSLLNFFEFTSQRARLSIWGPSFDCLYFHTPAAAPFGAPVLTSQGIYRDRADYLSTLAGLQTITFRCVDFQLLALHLPLMRQRMTRLRSITLVHNNCHSLWQLDQLAVLAPAAAAMPSSGSQTPWPAIALESVVIRHNAVTALPLYRRYLISLLCMNAAPQSSTAQATTAVHSPRSSARGASRGSTASSLLQLQQLDGKPISDQEVRESHVAFAAFHAAKYALDFPASTVSSSATSSTRSGQSSTPVSSRWMELLYETSVATAGGLTALGTAANPLHAVHWNSAHFGSPSSLPLPPVRPVATTPQARKHARKLAD